MVDLQPRSRSLCLRGSMSSGTTSSRDFLFVKRLITTFLCLYDNKFPGCWGDQGQSLRPWIDDYL